MGGILPYGIVSGRFELSSESLFFGFNYVSDVISAHKNDHDDVPPDNLETCHAERIMLVSGSTEYSSCLDSKRKISDVSVTEPPDSKCPVCGTSQLLTDYQKKVNVGANLQIYSPWLTLFQHVWEPHVPGLHDVTHALLKDLRNVSLTC